MKLISIKQDICNLELTGIELSSIQITLANLYEGVSIEIDEQKFEQQYKINRGEVIAIETTFSDKYDWYNANILQKKPQVIARGWCYTSEMDDVISMELSKRELYIIWVIFNDIRRGDCIEVDMEEYPTVCGFQEDELQAVTDEINKLYAQVAGN